MRQDWIWHGGRPCLDLVNTLRERWSATPRELLVSPADLEQRRRTMEARGPGAWRPNRDRNVSQALQAYARMATSAARGAVRDIGQLPPANRAGAARRDGSAGDRSKKSRTS